MKIKPTKGRGNVLVEVGPGESKLLSPEAAKSTTTPFQLKRILVPTDFSECARKALQYAIPFASQFQAEILCVHVINIPYGAGEAGIVVETEVLRKRLHKQVKQQMADLLAQELSDRVRSQSLIRFGTPYHEIVQTARENDIDLIIVATHGRTGLGRFVLGSTTERVVRHAHCPVLVVREEEREFVTGAGAQA